MSFYQKIYRSELSHRARSVYMYLKDHATRRTSAGPGSRPYPENWAYPAPRSNGP